MTSPLDQILKRTAEMRDKAKEIYSTDFDLADWTACLDALDTLAKALKDECYCTWDDWSQTTAKCDPCTALESSAKLMGG